MAKTVCEVVEVKNIGQPIELLIRFDYLESSARS